MTYTVVIADDDADIRALVAISVAKAGLEVVANVEDGASALAAITRFKPDLAILDVSMPEMTGLQVVSAIRANPLLGDVRVVLLTASVDEHTRASGTEVGADHFFDKPFSPRELTAFLTLERQQR
jgi:DNA-binding response OmpR family regulator